MALDSSFDVVIALLGVAVLTVFGLGLASTRELLRALPHLRAGVTRQEAARSVKRRHAAKSLEQCYGAPGLPFARRAAELTRWQGMALGFALALLIGAVVLGMLRPAGA